MENTKLTTYTVAAGALLSIPSSTDAQMVHVNVDPDYYGYGDYLYPIDMNADGISELNFSGNHFATAWSSGGEFDGYSIQSIWLDMFCTLASSLGKVKQLHLGDTVNEDMFFGAFYPLFFYGSREVGTGAGGVDIYAGMEWINQDGFFGMRFSIDGATHYGWIRLELRQEDTDVLPYLLVKEYAYNATPDAVAPIISYFASPASALVLSDVGESNTPSDLQLTFSKAEDEATVSSYRVVLLQGYYSPSVDDLEALTPDRYLEIMPTGEDQIITFPPSTLDYDGNALLPGVNYRAIVLSVADGVFAHGSDISSFSNFNDYNLESAPEADSLMLTTNEVDTDISGFIGHFTMSSVQVEAVRVFVTNVLATTEELLLLDDTFYMEVIPAIGDTAIEFTDDKLIYGGGEPVLFKSYNLQVLSLPDSVINSIPVSTYCIDPFLYANYAVAPTVTKVGNIGSAADILLNFSVFENEPDLDFYRIFICKSGTVPTQELVSALVISRYLDREPNGTNLDMTLFGLMRDTDGDMITEGQPYQVYVALKYKWDDYYCISLPSTEIVLGETLNIQDAIPPVQLVVYDGLITATGVAADGVLAIVNSAGQLIVRQQLPPGSITLPVPALSPGLYFAYLEHTAGAAPVRFVVDRGYTIF